MRTTIFCTGVLALSSFSATASAQGWLAGGSIGQSRQQDYTAGPPVTLSEDTGDAFRVFGGYLVSPMQGVVASYIDLGETRYGAPAFAGFVTEDFEADGIDVSYVAGWTPGSQQRVALFGTVGVFAWDQDVTYRDDVSGTIDYHDEGTSFSAGFGVEINLASDYSSAFSVHLGWQLLKNVGDPDNSGHEDDREILSAGVSYRFGRND